MNVSTKLLKPPEWTEDAVCASVDPVIFFPRKGGSAQRATSICASCPVVDTCLEWALEYEAGVHAGANHFASFGVYGGKTAVERRAILRERAALREAS